MDLVAQWLPLVAALGVAPLAWILFATRPNLRRAALLVSVGATLALLVAQGSVFAYSQLLHSPFPSSGYQATAALFWAASTLTELLAVAAWALLLAGAAQATDRRRLAVLAVGFALALALQIALSDPEVTLLAGLREWLAQQPTVTADLIDVALVHVSAVAALVAALLMPTKPATVPALPPDA
jgi:hypothetical protein